MAVNGTYVGEVDGAGRGGWFRFYATAQPLFAKIGHSHRRPAVHVTVSSCRSLPPHDAASLDATSTPSRGCVRAGRPRAAVGLITALPPAPLDQPVSASVSCPSPLLAVAPHCPPPPSPSVQSGAVSVNKISSIACVTPMLCCRLLNIGLLARSGPPGCRVQHTTSPSRTSHLGLCRTTQITRGSHQPVWLTGGREVPEAGG